MNQILLRHQITQCTTCFYLSHLLNIDARNSRIDMGRALAIRFLLHFGLQSTSLQFPRIQPMVKVRNLFSILQVMEQWLQGRSEQGLEPKASNPLCSAGSTRLHGLCRSSQRTRRYCCSLSQLLPPRQVNFLMPENQTQSIVSTSFRYSCWQQKENTKEA